MAASRVLAIIAVKAWSWSEVGNRQTKRIDRNQLIWHVVFEQENEVRRVERLLQHGVVCGGVLHAVEVNRRAVGWSLHGLQGALFHIDIDFR